MQGLEYQKSFPLISGELQEEHAGARNRSCRHLAILSLIPMEMHPGAYRGVSGRPLAWQKEKAGRAIGVGDECWEECRLTVHRNQESTGVGNEDFGPIVTQLPIGKNIGSRSTVRFYAAITATRHTGKRGVRLGAEADIAAGDEQFHPSIIRLRIGENIGGQNRVSPQASPRDEQKSGAEPGRRMNR